MRLPRVNVPLSTTTLLLFTGSARLSFLPPVLLSPFLIGSPWLVLEPLLLLSSWLRLELVDLSVLLASEVEEVEVCLRCAECIEHNGTLSGDR